MLSESQLRDKIMRRVWGIYLMRQLMNPILRLGILGVTVIFLTSSVSIKSVVTNALATQGLQEFTRFAMSAFTGTETSVKILAMLMLALVLWFVADTVRNVFFVGSLRADA